MRRCDYPPYPAQQREGFRLFVPFEGEVSHLKKLLI